MIPTIVPMLRVGMPFWTLCVRPKKKRRHRGASAFLLPAGF